MNILSESFIPDLMGTVLDATPKSQHAHLLHALDRMQQSPAYAVCRVVLREAELLILQQEQDILRLEKDLAQARAWGAVVEEELNKKI